MKHLKIFIITAVLIGFSLLFFSCTTLGYVLFYNVVTSPTTFEVSEDGYDLYMDGIISSKTKGQIKKIFKKNPNIKKIIMGTIPGSINDNANFKIGELIRQKGMSTHVLKDSVVESGGVDLFLAGIHRTMEDGAQFGVHSWEDAISGETALDFPRDSEEHELYIAYMEQMLGSDDFYWFTIKAAPADDIYYMTNQEIIDYGLITEPIIDNS